MKNQIEETREKEKQIGANRLRHSIERKIERCKWTETFDRKKNRKMQVD